MPLFEELEEIDSGIEQARTTEETTPAEYQYVDPETTLGEETEEPPDEITFGNSPNASTCTLDDVTTYMNTFPTIEKQTRAAYFMIKKMIQNRDTKKEKTSEYADFIKMNQPDPEEHPLLSKTLQQAKDFKLGNTDLQSAITIPKELKTSEMNNIQKEIALRDKIRVSNIDSLKQYQHYLRTSLHGYAFEGIADILTTPGDFETLQKKYQKIYSVYLDDIELSQEKKLAVIKICKAENKLLFHILRTKFLWHSVLTRKMENLLTMREEDLPSIVIGLVALSYVRTQFNTVTLDAIITATMGVMVAFTTSHNHDGFESWHLSYEKQMDEYIISYGQPTWNIIRLCNTYLALKAQDRRYSKILDLHRMSFPSTMAKILENADDIRAGLEEAATKWDLTIVQTKDPHGGFKKRENAGKRAHTYNMMQDILGIEPPGTTNKPSTYQTIEDKACSYCGQSHLRSQCDYVKTDKVLKENAGTIIPHIVKLAETVEKSLFEIRKKKPDFDSKELKQLGRDMERFQNRDINSLVIAGQRVRDLYDRRTNPRQPASNQRKDDKKAGPRYEKPTNRDRPPRPIKDRNDNSHQKDRSLSATRKPVTNTADKNKKQQERKKPTKKLTFSVGDNLSATEDEHLTGRYASTSDEDHEAYGFFIKAEADVPDHWEILAETQKKSINMGAQLTVYTTLTMGENDSNEHPNIQKDKLQHKSEAKNESIEQEENSLHTTETTKKGKSLQDYAESFTLETLKCGFCNHYHTKANCWLKSMQDKLDEDMETGMINEYEYFKKSAELYKPPSGSGTKKVPSLPFGNDTEDYLTLISAQTKNGEYILTNPVTQNCLYTAVQQATWINETNHTEAVDHIHKSIFNPHEAVLSIAHNMRHRNAHHLTLLLNTKTNAFINTLAQDTTEEKFTQLCEHIQSHPAPSCMLEVASLSDMLNRPIEVMRETHDGKLASYLYLTPNGTVEPPFRKPEKKIQLLLKDDHFNMILPSNSAMAPDKTSKITCPLTSPDVHWITPRENNCPTPCHLKKTKFQVLHNTEVEALTQNYLADGTDQDEPRAALHAPPTLTIYTEYTSLPKPIPKSYNGEGTTFSQETFGKPASVSLSMHLNKPQPQTTFDVKPSSKRSLFKPLSNSQSMDNEPKTPDLLTSSDEEEDLEGCYVRLIRHTPPLDESARAIKEEAKKAGKDIWKSDFNTSEIHKCALPTCNMTTTINPQTSKPLDFCTRNHAIQGGKIPSRPDVKNEWIWDGNTCKPIKQDMDLQGAKLHQKTKPAETNTQTICALPGCQDHTANLNDTSLSSHPDISRTMSDHFCCTTHAIVGGAIPPQWGYIASCSWNGETCTRLNKTEYEDNIKKSAQRAPMDVLKAENERLTAEAKVLNEKISTIHEGLETKLTDASNRILELMQQNTMLIRHVQIAKGHEDFLLHEYQGEINEVKNALQKSRIKLLKHIKNKNSTDATVITSQITNATNIDHWAIQISESLPYQAARLTTSLTKIFDKGAITNDTLHNMVEKIQEYNIHAPKLNIDSTKADMLSTGESINRLTTTTVTHDGSTTVTISGNYRSIPVGLALFHELTSDTAKMTLGHQSTPSTKIAFRINEGPNETLNMDYNASEPLAYKSNIMIAIRQTEDTKEYILRQAAPLVTDNTSPTSRVQKRKDKPSPPHPSEERDQLHHLWRHLVKELQYTCSNARHIPKKNSPDAKKHHQ